MELTNKESSNKDFEQSHFIEDVCDKVDVATNKLLHQESLVDSVQKGTMDSNFGKEGSSLGIVIPESVLDSPENIMASGNHNDGDDSFFSKNKNQWETREEHRDLEDSYLASVLSDNDLGVTGFSGTNLLGISQSSLCGNFNKLVMRSKRGRPSRKSRKWKNPFDFKLSSRMVNKQNKTKGRNKKIDNASRMNIKTNDVLARKGDL